MGFCFTGVPSESNLKDMSKSFQGETGKNCYLDHISSSELFQFLFQTCFHLKEPELQSGGMSTIFLESHLSTST